MEITQKRYKYNNRQPRPRKKRPLIWIMVATLLLSISSYSFLALTKPVPSVKAETIKLFSLKSQDMTIQWPSSGMAAIGGLEEGLLATSAEPAGSVPIASMAKVVTALAVLEKEPIPDGEQGETYIFTEADVVIYNQYVAKYGSVMPIKAGQRLTQYQMLQGLLLPSANNIADSLTIDIFGSPEAYIEYANKLVNSYGLKQTFINDASGFSPATVSTPSDMVIIGQKALQNRVIAEIVSQQQAIIPESGVIRNTNLLLGDQNVIGIKTGTTDEAGSCLLFAVKHGPDLKHTLVGVVMGQANWPQAYNNARLLRDSALNNFENIELVPADSAVATYKTEWGESGDAVNKQPLSFYGWKAKDYTSSVETRELTVPAVSGTSVGDISTDGVKSELYLNEDIKSPSVAWRLLNYW